MRCETARAAISIALDGEPVARSTDQVEAHLAGCPGCRDWQELAHVVTRRMRLGGGLPPPDLTSRILGAVREDEHRRRLRQYWLGFARGVVVVGLLQLLATVPLLLLARDHTSGGGRVHVLGLIELAIGAGFFVGALVVLWRVREQSSLEVVPALRRPEAVRPAPDNVSEVA